MAKIKVADEKFKYEIYNVFHLFYDEVKFVNDSKYDYKLVVKMDSIEVSQGSICEIYEYEKELTEKENVKKILYRHLSKVTGKNFPWGTLVGIRPTKIVLRLLKDGKTTEQIKKYFKHHSLTREDKINLCIDVAKIEKTFVNKKSKSISIYIGMPFCPTRCLYCSFISDTIKNCKNIVEDYLKAMYYEMDRIAEYIKSKNLNIECVYFGGGTPTSIDNYQFHDTMMKIYNNFIVNNNVKEFTVECGRPDSINERKLNILKKFKVQRISINPQTMNDSTLKLIGRGHNSKDMIDKFKLARNLGFNNINVDIIVGLPGENLKEIKYTCNEILQLSPESLTVHGMSLKRGSKLHQNILNNIEMKIASTDELDKMYNETVKLSRKLNLKPYYMYRQKNMVGHMENVGYSIPGKECIYNVEMIEERQTIIGIGANAVSKIIFLDENRLERFPNLKDIREYTKRIEEKVKSKIEFLNELYS